MYFFGGQPQQHDAHGVQTTLWIQNAGYIWVPFIVLSAFAAWFGMDNLATMKAGLGEQIAIFRRKHQWLLSWLYTGTFGSFIGLAAGLPMLLQTEFPLENAFRYAFIGPLLAALVRPLGGWLADRYGGARITFWAFGVMAVAVSWAGLFLPTGGNSGSLVGFFLMFLLLFIAAGVGNGSIFRMIPIAFRMLHERLVADRGKAALEEARRTADTEAAATLGVSSALAAFGGFFIPITYSTAISLSGGPQPALLFFDAFYLSCLLITWRWYSRQGAEAPC